jgi:hypothetical protein
VRSRVTEPVRVQVRQPGLRAAALEHLVDAAVTE